MRDRIRTSGRIPAGRLGTAVTALLLAAAVAACDSTDGPTTPDPDVRPTEQLRFLRPAADAPPLVSNEVRFWAKRGQDREVFMYYRPRPGRTDSTEFVRFKVPGSSLERRPDGTLFQQGDSVLITLKIADPSRLILDFQPSGLRFAASAPARLKISFADANDDYDGDGDVDSNDSQSKQQFAIWRQEAPGLPWYKMTSRLELSTEEIEADLVGFTGYAIAF